MRKEGTKRLFLSIPFIGIAILGAILLLLWSSLWTEGGTSPYDSLAAAGVLMILVGGIAVAFIGLRG